MDSRERQQATKALAKRAEFERNLAIRAHEDEEFKQRLLNDPKSIYEEELGTQIPESFEVRVIEEEPNSLFMVLPRKNEAPTAEGELSEAALETVAGGKWISVKPGPQWVVAWS